MKINAEKHEKTQEQLSSRSGYRVRRLDTRRGSLYLMVPKIRTGGYPPVFPHRIQAQRSRSDPSGPRSLYQRSVDALHGETGEISWHKNLSKSQVSEMNKGLNEQAEAFWNRSLTSDYPVLRVDALYEKVRYDGRVIAMAIQVVCGVNEDGEREVFASEPMMEESTETYSLLFQKLKDRGLRTPKLVISDAHSGLVKAIQQTFPRASWQRCKVHFMRNILAYVPQSEKESFVAKLKMIWMTATTKEAKKIATDLANEYRLRFPDAIRCLEEGLEDSLAYYAFPALDAKKVSSTNMLERLNREIRRRTRKIGIFPSPESYTRLLSMYLLEYTEDWSCGKAYLSKEFLETLK